MSELIAFVIKTVLSLVALGLVFVGAKMAFTGGNIATTLSNTSHLALAVQSNYSAQASFASLTPEIMVRMAPKGMVAANQMINSWNGVITGGVDPANAAQFFIEHPNLPQDACAKLATLSGVRAVQINGGVVHTQTIDAAAAINQCNSATESNTVRLTFGRA